MNITSSVVMIASPVMRIASSVVMIASSVMMIASSVTMIASSVMMIASSVMMIASSAMMIASSVMMIASSRTKIASSVIKIASSVVKIDAPVMIITASVVNIMSSVVKIQASAVEDRPLSPSRRAGVHDVTPEGPPVGPRCGHWPDRSAPHTRHPFRLPGRGRDWTPRWASRGGGIFFSIVANGSTTVVLPPAPRTPRSRSSKFTMGKRTPPGRASARTLQDAGGSSTLRRLPVRARRPYSSRRVALPHSMHRRPTLSYRVARLDPPRAFRFRFPRGSRVTGTGIKAAQGSGSVTWAQG